ncbi:hypothetical protein ACFFF5_09380 [Lederbergia wuyishanensis]|uniref:Uncharacterized protein n=1 Tax=Lederbergia wuyishanensis TaxID=1347903 RepID=A0ABU0D7X2_9BACI|nr:hypothetical protein [Lederbergia wuyishanensis]MCJ8009103.1 hypothetical protein [Lederbergia wuyishanensis]MDQ0344441.1 hypothetical protein [Lederbergia wuyishanensis]
MTKSRGGDVRKLEAFKILYIQITNHFTVKSEILWGWERGLILGDIGVVLNSISYLFFYLDSPILDVMGA